MPQHDTARPRLPAVSFIVAGLALVGMSAWSILQWPAMEPSIVTREAAGNHGTSTVPRLVTASVMPLALAVLTVLLTFAPRIDQRYLKLLGDPGTANMKDRKASPRVLGLLLIGFSVLFATLHVAFISLHTPAELPITSLISTAIGVLLVLIGAALPIVQPRVVTGTKMEARLRTVQRRAYRTTAPLIMVFIGAATITGAWLAPPSAMPIAISGVAVLFIGLVAITIVRAKRTPG